ncbi:MAG: GGDEF domain-containing protein [Paucibacter sp.]|nr:GGDEF domain-containing protein [Roseateles sp.]
MVDGELLNRCRRVAELAALLVMGLSIMALVGWTLDNDWMRSIVPGMVPMNPLVAFCLMAAGAVMWRRRRASGSKNFSRLGLACGLLLVLVGTSRLIGYVTPWDLGADRWLFASRLAVDVMAPNTAGNLLLLGIALSLIVAGRAALLAQLLVTLSSAISFMALLGYVYQVPLFGLPGYMPMAFHTSLCFLLIELGLLAGSADAGFVAMLISTRSGGRAARRMLPSALLLPTLLGALGIYGMRHDWFVPEYALALMATFCSVGLVATLLLAARWLNDGDAEVERLLTVDTLTGVLNRRTVLNFLDTETAACLRYRMPLCAAMVDIDHFKRINDQHGHAAGDAVLGQLGAQIRSSLRETDAAGRYGGEEFVIVLPHTSVQGAAFYAERLRRSIADAQFRLATGERIFVTVSIGLAEVTAGESPQPEQALGRADAALYKAKRDGRNRVQLAADVSGGRMEPVSETRLAQVAGAATPPI